MIVRNGKQLASLIHNGREVGAVCHGTELVWKAGILPMEYKQVSFLRNLDRTAYVSSGLNGGAYDYADITLQCYEQRSNRQLMGHATTTAHYFGVSAAGQFEIGNATISREIADPFAINVVRWEPPNSRSDGYAKLTVNGYMTRRSASSRVTTTLFKFFTLNSSTYGGSYKIFGGRFFLADGTVVGDFIPCLRRSDGKAGMYNLVNGEFCAGSGSFSAG